MIEIINPDKVKIFRRNSLLHKKIEYVCSRLGLSPRVQVFKAGYTQLKDGVRGATYGDLITLYWSDLETTNSMFWVFCHELRHYMMWKTPRAFKRVFETEEIILRILSKTPIKRLNLSREGRLLYHIRPTEIIGDLFATEILGKDYGDDWYERRQQTKRSKKNE